MGPCMCAKVYGRTRSSKGFMHVALCAHVQCVVMPSIQASVLAGNNDACELTARLRMHLSS